MIKNFCLFLQFLIIFFVNSALAKKIIYPALQWFPLSMTDSFTQCFPTPNQKKEDREETYKKTGLTKHLDFSFQGNKPKSSGMLQ